MNRSHSRLLTSCWLDGLTAPQEVLLVLLLLLVLVLLLLVVLELKFEAQLPASADPNQTASNWIKPVQTG
ncbi:MAG TPA: hypothetical protein VL361_08695 [Candidatus Limnocylindrales bacterium]|nr:hypothetical protein [Candidatus Limnocylindrales bacterium]